MNMTLSAFHNTATSIKALDEMLIEGRKNTPDTNNNSLPFLRLDAEGNGWVFGREDTEIEKDSQWAVNPFSFRTGWICWADPKKNGGTREKLGDIMVPIKEASDRPDIDHTGKGGEWVEQFGFDLICLAGVDDGETVTYNTNSYGGKQAFKTIFDATSTRPHVDFCYPLVELDFDSYKNTTYKKTVYTPLFNVVDWLDKEKKLLSTSSLPEITPETKDKRTPRRRQTVV